MKQASGKCRLLLAFLLMVLTTGAIAQQAPKVDLATAEMDRVVEEVPVTGTVTSPDRAQLSSAIAGLVEQVHVEAGDRIKADQLLVTLDPELARHELERLQAAVTEARAGVANARRRLEEAESLQSRRSIAKSEVEDRRAALDVAAANLAQTQAEIKLQEARLERHSVEAPFAGVIARKMTAAGEWVEPGTPLLELVDLEHLRIDYAVPQAVFPRLTTSTEIRIRPSGMDEPVSGHIERIVPVTDAQSRSFTIHVVADEPLALSPGMSAQGLIRLVTDERAVVIPRDGLMRQPNGRTSVWVVDPEAEQPVAKERKVEVGRVFGDRVSIRSGLEAGEQVVTRGNNRLQDGQTVRVQ